MKNIEIKDESTGEVAVPIDRVYRCDLCHDTGMIETLDAEGFPSGYYETCICAL